MSDKADGVNSYSKNTLPTGEGKCSSLGSPLYINENEEEEDDMISNVAVAGTSSPFLASQSPLDEEQHTLTTHPDEMNSRDDILEHDFIDDDDEDVDDVVVNDGNDAVNTGNEEKQRKKEEVQAKNVRCQPDSLILPSPVVQREQNNPPRSENKRAEQVVVLNKTNLASFERSVQEGRVPLRADTVGGNYIDVTKPNTSANGPKAGSNLLPVRTANLVTSSPANAIAATTIPTTNTNAGANKDNKNIIIDSEKEKLSAAEINRKSSNNNSDNTTTKASVSDSIRTNYPASTTIRTDFSSPKSQSSFAKPSAANVAIVKTTPSPTSFPVLPCYTAQCDKIAQVHDEKEQNTNLQGKVSPHMNELEHENDANHSHEHSHLHDVVERENKADSSQWLESVHTINDSDQLHFHMSNEDSVQALAGDEDDNAVGPSPNLYPYLASTQHYSPHSNCVHAKLLLSTEEIKENDAVHADKNKNNNNSTKQTISDYGQAKNTNDHYRTVHVDVNECLKQQQKQQQEQEKQGKYVDVTKSYNALLTSTTKPVASVPSAAETTNALPPHPITSTTVKFTQNTSLSSPPFSSSSQPQYHAAHFTHTHQHHKHQHYNHNNNHHEYIHPSVSHEAKMSEQESAMSPNSSMINDKLSLCSNESLANHSTQLTLADPLNEENLKLHLMELNSGVPLPLRMENIVSNFECVKVKQPHHSNTEGTDDSNKDSCSHIPQPSETEPSITITRYFSTEKDDDELNTGSISTASPLTYRTRTDGDDDIRHHGFPNDTNGNHEDRIHSNNHVNGHHHQQHHNGESNLNNNNNTNNSNSENNNINNNRSSLYDLIEDAWSTTSTGEAELNFLSTCSSLSEHNIQSLSKENLMQFRRQLESGTTPLRPEILANLSGFVKSMAKPRAHSEVSSMLVEVPRDEERQLNDESIISTDSPLLRRHTRSRERDKKKTNDMPPPSKVSKVLPLHNDKRVMCKTSGSTQEDNNENNNNLEFDSAKKTSKVKLIQESKNDGKNTAASLNVNQSENVKNKMSTQKSSAAHHIHSRQHGSNDKHNDNDDDDDDYEDDNKNYKREIKPNEHKSHHKSSKHTTKRSPRGSVEPNSNTKLPRNLHVTQRQNISETMYEPNDEIPVERKQDEDEEDVVVVVHGVDEVLEKEEVEDDDDDGILSVSALEEEEEEEDEELKQKELEEEEEEQDNDDNEEEDEDEEETSRIMPSKPVRFCNTRKNVGNAKSNTHITSSEMHSSRHKYHRRHDLNDLANASENDYNAGVSFNSTAVEAPETEVPDTYHNSHIDHDQDGTMTNNSSLHDDLNESVENKKSGTPCSRSVRFDHMDDYDTRDMVKLKEQMREVSSAVVHLQTDFSLLRTSLDSKLENVFATLEGQLKNAARLTADIQLMHHTLAERITQLNSHPETAKDNIAGTNKNSSNTTNTETHSNNNEVHGNIDNSKAMSMDVKIPLVMRLEVDKSHLHSSSLPVSGKDFVVPCTIKATVGECKQEFLRRLRTLQVESSHTTELTISNTVLCVDNRVLFDEDELCVSLGVTDNNDNAKDQLSKYIFVLKPIISKSTKVK